MYLYMHPPADFDETGSGNTSSHSGAACHHAWGSQRLRQLISSWHSSGCLWKMTCQSSSGEHIKRGITLGDSCVRWQVDRHRRPWAGPIGEPVLWIAPGKWKPANKPGQVSRSVLNLLILDEDCSSILMREKLLSAIVVCWISSDIKDIKK